MRAIAGAAKLSSLEPRTRFDTIEMRNIVFRYMDKSSEAVFRVGPFNFTLHSGDLVFISGGKGYRQIDIPQTALGPVRARFRRDPA